MVFLGFPTVSISIESFYAGGSERGKPGKPLLRTLVSFATMEVGLTMDKNETAEEIVDGRNPAPPWMVETL